MTSKWAICLLNRLFRRRSQQTLNLRVTGLCERNSPVIGKLTAQRASNAAKCFHSMPPSWLWTYNNAAPQFSFKWDFHRNGISSKATNLKSIFRYFWNHRGSCRFFFFFFFFFFRVLRTHFKQNLIRQYKSQFDIFCFKKHISVNTLKPRQNGRLFRRWYFQMHFLQCKSLHFD